MISKKSIDRLKQEIRRAKAKNRYYKNKGEQQLFNVKSLPEILDKVSSTKEVNRYTRLLKEYNKRGSFKKNKKGVPQWETKMLSKIRQYNRYDSKVKEQKQNKKNKKDKGFTYLGDDIKNKKPVAQYNQTPKDKTPSDYINQGFERTTKKEYQKRCDMFKRNYLWACLMNLGQYGTELYELIKPINSIFFYEDIYLPYQSELDIDFIYSDIDAMNTASRIQQTIDYVIGTTNNRGDIFT